MAFRTSRIRNEPGIEFVHDHPGRQRMDLQSRFLLPVQLRGKPRKRASAELAGQVRHRYRTCLQRDPPLGNGHRIGEAGIAAGKVHILDLHAGPDVLQALAQDQSPGGPSGDSGDLRQLFLEAPVVHRALQNGKQFAEVRFGIDFQMKRSISARQPQDQTAVAPAGCARRPDQVFPMEDALRDDDVAAGSLYAEGNARDKDAAAFHVSMDHHILRIAPLGHGFTLSVEANPWYAAGLYNGEDLAHGRMLSRESQRSFAERGHIQFPAFQFQTSLGGIVVEQQFSRQVRLGIGQVHGTQSEFQAIYPDIKCTRQVVADDGYPPLTWLAARFELQAWDRTLKCSLDLLAAVDGELELGIDRRINELAQQIPPPLLYQRRARGRAGGGIRGCRPGLHIRCIQGGESTAPAYGGESLSVPPALHR